MPCYPIGGDGWTGFVCTRGTRITRRCSVPGCRAPGEFLCDQPLGGSKTGKTCDKPLCVQHAVEVGTDRHLCPPHFTISKKTG